MVRCDGNGRLCEQDDRRPKQDAGWDGREGESSNFDLTLASKVGMLFRFIATGIGGFVYPFTQVERSKIGNSFFSFVRTGSYPWSF